MTKEPTTPQEWIEHHKQERVAAGTSLAEQEMIKALAEVVIADKLARMWISPGNSKGRCSSHFEGEPTEAEQKWSEMMAAHKQTRVVKGGPHIGKEF